jgi:LPXTG-motif cell wall-anchored protein
MTNLLHYFITATPGPEMRFFIPLFTLAGLLILSSIIFSIIYKKKKKENLALKASFKSLSKILMLLGLGFLFLTAFRFENIPYFSMRIWLYSLCLISLYTAYYYIKEYASYLKQKKQTPKNTQTTKRYSTAKKRK